jgi:hypothetical protein
MQFRMQKKRLKLIKTDGDEIGAFGCIVIVMKA